jgi:hypothetical protein
MVGIEEYHLKLVSITTSTKGLGQGKETKNLNEVDALIV